MMEVKTKALPLLAVADHISRASPVQYGALVGTRHPESLTITDAFDAKHDTTSLDISHLEKKLTLLQTGSPAIELVGVYTCEENGGIPSNFHVQLAQAQMAEPLVFLAPSTDGSFRCFILESGEEIPYTLTPVDSEVTAVSTVQNHANYSQKEPDLTQENEASLGASFRQLEEHVRSILALEHADAYTEKQIVHLGQLVLGYTGCAASESHQMYSSHLSLLASQIATSRCADAQTSIQTAAIDKRGHTLALGGWNSRA